MEMKMVKISGLLKIHGELLGVKKDTLDLQMITFIIQKTNFRKFLGEHILVEIKSTKTVRFTNWSILY